MGIFVDDLPLELFTMAFVMVLSLYITADAFIKYRKSKDLTIKQIVRDGSVPLGIMGIIVLIFGIYGEFLWPLPGSYNILFYDPYIFFGIIVLMIAAGLWLKQKLQYTGLLALFAGVIAIFYGSYGYADKFTSEPLAMLGLYIAFGLTGVFVFPVTLMLDGSENKKSINNVWLIILAIFWIGLVVSAVLAALIGFEAIPAHLLAPP